MKVEANKLLNQTYKGKGGKKRNYYLSRAYSYRYVRGKLIIIVEMTIVENNLNGIILL